MSPALQFSFATKTILAARQKPGTWEHWSAKGKTVIDQQFWDIFLKSFKSDVSRAIFSLIYTFIGGVLIPKPNEAVQYVDFDTSVVPEEILAGFPLPSQFKVNNTEQYQWSNYNRGILNGTESISYRVKQNTWAKATRIFFVLFVKRCVSIQMPKHTLSGK